MKFYKSMFLIITVVSSFTISFSQEICDNGIDDNGNGLIDFQEMTCNCTAYDIFLPNSSFENHSACPFAYTQMNLVNNWQQGSGPTSDYFNNCGYRYHPSFKPPPLPIPDGDGYVGFYNNGFPAFLYKEYVGTCLNETMFAGVKYNLEFYLAFGKGSLATDFAIFGSENCGNMPFITTSGNWGCPLLDSNWICLDSIDITVDSTKWTKYSMTFVPNKNIKSIIVGPACKKASTESYYYLDYGILKQEKAKSEFKMPNVFTPNNDNKNDYFIPLEYACISKANLTIYNRWGQIVYESLSSSITWDGKYNEKDCSEGVYFWVVNYEGIDGEKKLSGTVSLFR